MVFQNFPKISVILILSAETVFAGLTQKFISLIPLDSVEINMIQYYYLAFFLLYSYGMI